MYRPNMVREYFNSKFWTENDSLYTLDGAGKIEYVTRESDMEGCLVTLLAGIDEEAQYELKRRTKEISHPPSRSSDDLLRKKQYIDQLIITQGQRPEPGLFLIMSVSNEDALRTSSVGISTSRLSYIEQGKQK